ncbi:hypothetical protein M409DRAFT_24339 [Zasmidium cellare ATCC 36951]|uniref:Uncharacterized protein n=1 Tax=Zasmidium cellare ATCC 36951 TaxID=1080233 RepID=A0A6A6CH26_ZASCE|nr:uncharacterized protein M409DRAFT_24339 [Zasmidium cellare ATCC 36951]KAF2165488.1 hypothetical protein M409DRAFT_24339 [Zasmidium cellare ATCC 36951]
MASDTADAQPCRLLGIPREVRNIIYEYLTVDDPVHITHPTEPGAESKNTVVLGNAPIVSVFQTCKQIRAEYKDVCFKKAMILIYATMLNLRYGSFDFKRGVPKKLFKNVSMCHLKIPFYLLQEVDDPNQLREFIIDVSVGEAEEETYDREWTPSKDAVERLSVMLNQLGRWIREKQASVYIDLVVHSSMEDFEDWTHRRLVQPPTFAYFAHDQHTAFAAVNKVDLCFSLHIPLSSEIKAWDIDPDLLIVEEDVATEAAADSKTVRETDDGIAYETADSKQQCTWLLFPKCRSHAAGGWCGFRPQFNGISQCTCCRHK